MNLQHVDMMAGDDRTLSFTARDAQQNTISLSGATITWRAARNRGDDAEITKSGTVVSASAGTFTVPLVPSDTADRAGDYEHVAFATVGGLTKTLVQGRLRIRSGIDA